MGVTLEDSLEAWHTYHTVHLCWWSVVETMAVMCGGAGRWCGWGPRRGAGGADWASQPTSSEASGAVGTPPYQEKQVRSLARNCSHGMQGSLC
jgi:hypothetical protein